MIFHYLGVLWGRKTQLTLTYALPYTHLVYVETCQQDRAVVANIPAYFDKITRLVDDLSRQLNTTKTDTILARYPQLSNMYIKTAYGIGKNNISITCPLKINILFIEFSGTKADRGTVDEFNR